MNIKTQVAIIGFGPVGALLGNLLGQRGISCVILEKQQVPYPLPRAVHFDAEVMRAFQSAGLAEAVLPLTILGKGMRFLDDAGNVLVDWPRSQKVGPLGWHESYRFHQPDLEKVLRDGLARFKNCQAIFGHGVTDVAENTKGVTLTLDDGRKIQAEYVVGCDGAQSFLREFLGIEYEDLGFKQRWMVVDLLIDGLGADRGDHTLQFCNPDHPATYLRGPGNRRRWEVRLEDGDTGPGKVGEAWQRLERWVSPRHAEMERLAIYTFRAAVTKKWRMNRCFLAGDAAHLTPPFMGQGLCAGIRDVTNLAWKLAAVFNGADDALLDTYGSERAPNVREFIRLAVDLGQLINQTTAGETPDAVMQSIWPPLGPGLGARDGLGGALAPQFRLADGVLADDRVGGGFYALAQEPVECGLPVFTEGRNWLLEKDVFGVILRPDGYIFGSGQDAAQLGRLAQEIPDV